jgi:hypothetical protein
MPVVTTDWSFAPHATTVCLVVIVSAYYICFVIPSALSSLLHCHPERSEGPAFAVPGATATEINSLSPAGMIAGDYTDANGVVHGYLLCPLRKGATNSLELTTRSTPIKLARGHKS